MNKPMWKRRALSLGGLFAAALAAMATSKSVELKGELRVDGEVVRVTNHDSSTWTRVRLSIEPCGEEIKLMDLPSGKGGVIPLRGFKKVNGQDYDPVRDGPIQLVQMRATMDGAYGHLEWRPDPRTTPSDGGSAAATAAVASPTSTKDCSAKTRER